MTDELISIDKDNKLAYEKSLFPPIVSGFSIKKLYGYRNVSFDTNYSTCILIAKNGSGKTTLLGALNSILHFELYKFEELNFESISININSESINLTKNEIISYLNYSQTSELLEISKLTGIETEEIFNEIIRKSSFSAVSSKPRNNIGSMLQRRLAPFFDYSQEKIRESILKVRESYFSIHENIGILFKAISKLHSEYDVIYLPTYRRIEVSLYNKDTSDFIDKDRNRVNFSSDSIFSGEIQFGLSDISERLSQLSQEIILKSNNGYRDISANIINELIGGEYKQKDKYKRLPTPDELKLFFTRIESSNKLNPRKYMMGPFININTPNLDKLYPIEHIPEDSRVFLKYFLSQLAIVIDAIKDVEEPVAKFIENCNKYLSTDDFSAIPNNNIQIGKNKDGKKLSINRRNLSVKVERTSGSGGIPLDSLSSGEKQMISIFAKLFLYPKKKIVLIDEPEISLSINWQSRILIDIINSTLCSQLISVTHSPFIFENSLEPFAKSIKLRLLKNQSSPHISELGGINFLEDDINE